MTSQHMASMLSRRECVHTLRLLLHDQEHAVVGIDSQWSVSDMTVMGVCVLEYSLYRLHVHECRMPHQQPLLIMTTFNYKAATCLLK